MSNFQPGNAKMHFEEAGSTEEFGYGDPRFLSVEEM